MTNYLLFFQYMELCTAVKFCQHEGCQGLVTQMVSLAYISFKSTKKNLEKTQEILP